MSRNIGNDFLKYAKSEGISGSTLDRVSKQIDNSLTPYILEEREMRYSQMDVFSRLMKDRLIWVSGVVSQDMCDVLQAQLMYLDSVDSIDIKMHINSPGGSVLHGLGVVDVMNYINCDISTINVGLAASMGSILLSSGTKGKRSSLNLAKVMIHQVSSGTQGHVEDNRISHIESEKYNYILFKMLSNNSGRTLDEVLEVANRDKWLTSTEALSFGLIDEIIEGKGTKIDDLLEGFDDHLAKVLSKISK